VGKLWGYSMRDVLGFAIFVTASLVGFAVARVTGAPATPPPAAEIHYAPDENLERVDVRLIDEARASIDMDAYVLTDRPVIGALERAARRGVKVRVWRDGGMAEKVEAFDVAALVAPDEPRFEMRTKPPGPLMHLKGYCLDGAVLRTGSANFSHSGLTAQDNDLVVLRSAQACAGFEAKFGKVWGDHG
jgi:phosphatidylserine/phosphatidylglycerophosphate/cardiolipin synthase-like enzyme